MKKVMIVIVSLALYSTIISGQNETCELENPLFAPGAMGIVTPGDPNNVRDAPSTSATWIGEIPGNGRFTVLDDPVCADNYIWWHVRYGDLTGWTVQGTDSTNWVEAIAPYANTQQITLETIGALEPVIVLEADRGYPVAVEKFQRVIFSEDGRYLVAQVGGGSLVTWDIGTGEQIHYTNSPLALGSPAEKILLRSDNRYLVWYTERYYSELLIHDLSNDSKVESIYFDEAITDIAFSPTENSILVASGELHQIILPSLERRTLYSLPENLAYAQSVAIAPDGETVSVVVNHGTGLFPGRIYNWDWETSTEISYFEAPEIFEDTHVIRGNIVQRVLYWDNTLWFTNELKQWRSLQNNVIGRTVEIPRDSELVLPPHTSDFYGLLTIDNRLQFAALNDPEQTGVIEPVLSASFNPQGNLLAIANETVEIRAIPRQ